MCKGEEKKRIRNTLTEIKHQTNKIVLRLCRLDTKIDHEYMDDIPFQRDFCIVNFCVSLYHSVKLLSMKLKHI